MTQIESVSNDDNSELAQMYTDDQSDRAPFATSHDQSPEFWSDLRKRDSARRERARIMLAKGLVRTANDYHHCAMLFQHSEEPDDYLLAHILATMAGFCGHSHGKWLSAAALDRFLMNIGRTQVFGTQYRHEEGKLALEPVAEILSDSVRAGFRIRPCNDRPPSGGSWLG